MAKGYGAKRLDAACLRALEIGAGAYGPVKSVLAKKLDALLRYAKLRHQAAPEDIDYRAPRGLERPLMQELLKGGWIDAHIRNPQAFQ